MDDRIEQQIQDLLQAQSLGVLATSAGGHPYTTLVGFVATADMREIYFATHRSTRKFAHIRDDERVTLLIDNRTNRAEDFRQAAALTAFGLACEVPAEEQPELKLKFLVRHPMLKEFVSSPGCALCRIRVKRYSLVWRFQDVLELNLDDPDPTS